MIKKEFGKKGEYVSAIGQGTMGIGGYFEKDKTRDDFFIDLLKAGIRYGMTFIDTAPAQGEGHSEELVGRAAKSRRKDIFISTKVSPENLAYKDVIRSVDNSLLRLKRDYIDLLQIHWPNPRIRLEETIEAMSDLVRAGKVRYIGLSNFSLLKLKEAHERLTKQGIASVQVEYNLFDRTIEGDILPYCLVNKIAVIAYSPLGKGRSIKGNDKISFMARLAKKYARTPAQIALCWLVHHANVFTIPKAARLDHLRENATSGDFKLEHKDIDLINKLFKQESILIPTVAIYADKIGLEKFMPSVEDLAESFRSGEDIKPIRVVPSRAKPQRFAYDLVEGKLRYWAWVRAKRGKVPIPAFIR